MLKARIVKHRSALMVLLLVVFASGTFAVADPAPVDGMLFPLSRYSAQGQGEDSFKVAFEDDSLYETGFQIQWTFDKNDESSWLDAGTLPPRNLPQTQQFTGSRPAGTYAVLPRVCPMQAPTTDTVYFRTRAMFTHGINGLPPTLDVINGPWYVDPAIAGPCGPTAVSGTVVGNQPQITWVNDSNPDPIKVENWIYRSASLGTLGSDPTLLVRLPATSTTFTDTAPITGQNSYYLVVAVRQKQIEGLPEISKSIGTPQPVVFNINGGPTPTPSSTATPTATPTPVPLFDPPSNLTAQLIGTNQAKLTWQDNSSSEDGWYIDFGPDTCACAGRFVLASPNTTTYTQSGLPLDATRYYRVRAYRNSDGAITDPSNLASVDTPPFAPTNLRTDAVTNAYVDLRWNDNSSTEDGFRVEYCNGSCGDSMTWLTIGTVGANQVTFRDGTVTGGITRSYRVFATKGLLSSPRSNIKVVTTPPSPLLPPSNLVASQIPNEGHKLSLTWQNNDPNTQSYKIEYASVPSGPWGTLATNVGPTSYLDTFALNGGQQRCYRVRAFASAYGSSDPSNISCATTFGPHIPIDPTSLTGVAIDSTHIKLQFIDNSSNEDGFRLYISLDGGNTFTYRTTIPPSGGVGNTIIHTDSNLKAATPYTYKVTAVNTEGESGPSNRVTVTTLGPPIPIWVNPNPNNGFYDAQTGPNNVSAYSCQISGTADATAGVDKVKVFAYDTVHGTSVTLYAPVDVNGNWKIGYQTYEFSPGRYNLNAYAHVLVGTQDVYSNPAVINGWTIPADQIPCPVTNP